MKRKINVTRTHLFALLVFAILFSGCGGVRIANVKPIDESKMNEHALIGTEPEDVPEYIIGVGDVLKVEIARHPELSGVVTVGSYGEIRLPESSDIIKAANRTISELEEEITSIVSLYIKSDPMVVVIIEKFNSKFIYVLGAVTTPGKYPLGDRLVTLRDAIFIAGMPVGDAALRKVIVVNSAVEKPVATRINFEEIMYGGRLKNNIVLNEGDIVFLPYTSFSKTMRTLDMIATPLGKAASGLAAYLYIHNELKD